VVRRWHRYTGGFLLFVLRSGVLRPCSELAGRIGTHLIYETQEHVESFVTLYDGDAQSAVSTSTR
jgi:hypothetical protein